MGPVLPGKLKQSNPGDKLQKLVEILAADNLETTIYHGLMSDWKAPASFVLCASEPSTALTDPLRWANLPNFLPWMMYVDLMSYLPDDILVKVDRASMGVSLEVRAPLLDHRVVEFAWRMPLSLRARSIVSNFHVSASVLGVS